MIPLRLSIIIPFYNVERYIADCLESVFDQDVPLDEYEVICVNDGSLDGSRSIVVDYMKRYSNLHLLEHECNRKLGTARNTGRKVAKGKFIWNVDSDDKIVSNCLGKLLKICENNNLDVLDFGRIRFWDDRSEDMINVRSTEKVISGLDYLEQLDSKDLSRMCVVWRRIIRREFLDENCIFSPEVNMGEDVPYSFKVLILAKRMMVIPDRCYCYRANPESLTGENWRPTSNTLYEKCFLSSRLIYDVVKEVPDRYIHVQNSFFNAARFTLSRYEKYVPLMTIEERKEFKSICRKTYSENGFVRDLLSKKGYARYQLWLWGLRLLSK